MSVEWDESSQETAGGTGRFVHPYNFVSLPTSGLGRAAEVNPFQRRKYVSHERYDPHLHSGHIDCTLTTQTHWFIPHADKSTMIPGTGNHKAMGYFTLDAVPESDWNHDDPTRDITRPAVPASSLRGMIRSVFEAATLSCFSVFDPRHLDLRIAYDLEQIPDGCEIPLGRGSAQFIPARVLKLNPDGAAVIQVLNGRDAVDPQNTVRAALIHAYSPSVRYKDKSTGKSETGDPTTLWRSLGDIVDGTPLAAVIDRKTQKKVKRTRDGRLLEYYFREAHQVWALVQSNYSISH